MTVKLNKGSTPHKVYSALLLHEWMSQEKLVEKSGVPADSISGALTKLRRSGLAIGSEEAHQKNGGRRWKKFKVDSPMYPPQPDFRKIESKKGVAVKKVLPTIDTLDEIIDRMITDFTLLREVVQHQNEQCKINEEKLKALQKVFQQ